jgi:4'-phosphopantetheinyl transferase EntD
MATADFSRRDDSHQILQGLVGEDVAIAEHWGHGDYRSMRPLEGALVAHAVDSRRREFSAGRSCARLGLNSFGVDEVVGIGPGGAPVWPAGFVGSITHTEGFCAAAVARRANWISIGIDAEIVDNVELALAPEILTRRELERLYKIPLFMRQEYLALLFSAKESTYKCQYPIAFAWLGFQDIVISTANNEFWAEILVRERDLRGVQTARGRFRRLGNMIVTAIGIEAKY